MVVVMSARSPGTRTARYQPTSPAAAAAALCTVRAARHAGAEAVAKERRRPPAGNVDPVAFPAPESCLLPSSSYGMDMVRRGLKLDEYPDSATSRTPKGATQPAGNRENRPRGRGSSNTYTRAVPYARTPTLEHGPARVSSAMQQPRLPHLRRVCRWNIPDASVSKVVIMNSTETRPDKRQVISRRQPYSTNSQRQEPGANE